MNSSSDKKKKKGSNWTGILFFLLLVVGPNITPSLSKLLFQVSGGNLMVSSDVLLVGMFGLLIMLTIGMRVVRFVQQQGEMPSSASVSSSASSAQSWQSQRTSTSTPRSQGASYAGVSSSLEALMQGKPLPSSYPSSTSTTSTSYRSEHDWDNDDTYTLFDNELFETSKRDKNIDWANRPSQLPHAPTFEPVINGKVVGLGILGALLLGGGFALFGFINGMFP